MRGRRWLKTESQGLGQPGRHSVFQASVGNRMKLSFSKGKKRSWVWWRTAFIPASRKQRHVDLCVSSQLDLHRELQDSSFSPQLSGQEPSRYLLWASVSNPVEIQQPSLRAAGIHQQLCQGKVLTMPLEWLGCRGLVPLGTYLKHDSSHF